MPIKYAALRSIRKDRKRQVRNQGARSELRTLRKRVAALIAAKQLDQARALAPAIAKKFDRAAARGLIHRNTAARVKSRLSRQLR